MIVLVKADIFNLWKFSAKRLPNLPPAGELLLPLREIRGSVHVNYVL
jgi:hypothetical protein